MRKDLKVHSQKGCRNNPDQSKYTLETVLILQIYAFWIWSHEQLYFCRKTCEEILQEEQGILKLRDVIITKRGLKKVQLF